MDVWNKCLFVKAKPWGVEAGAFSINVMLNSKDLKMDLGDVGGHCS